MDLKNDFLEELKTATDDSAVVEAAKKKGLTAVKMQDGRYLVYEDIHKPWESEKQKS